MGLSRDLATMNRRRALGLFAGAALFPLVGCGEDGAYDNGDASSEADGTTGSCSAIPEETAGPYPGDGSNGPNALALSGIERSDIRSSLGGATGVAAGVPLTFELTLVDASNSCAPLAGYAIYLWHCDRDGLYSMYSSAIANQSYLRGLQAADSNGKVTFQSIFPGCYSGRMPHVHFEIFPSIASSSNAQGKVATSQLAFPDSVCDAVYASSGYGTSASSYASISFATDNVFSDGVTSQISTVTGSVADGYVAKLVIGV